MEDKLTAWCVKCKKKVEMSNPEKSKTKRGVPMTKGTCPVCKTRVCRIGS